MSKRDTALLIDDMLEAADRIRRYTQSLSFEEFMLDDKTKDATVRNFEIIGEAANRIDSGFKKRNDQIDWKRLRGFRNRIVHDFFGIDYEIVWTILESDLEELVNQLKELSRTP